jgi:hypothetical protein
MSRGRSIAKRRACLGVARNFTFSQGVAVALVSPLMPKDVPIHGDPNDVSN